VAEKPTPPAPRDPGKPVTTGIEPIDVRALLGVATPAEPRDAGKPMTRTASPLPPPRDPGKPRTYGEETPHPEIPANLRRATTECALVNESPIPRDGKVSGWKMPRGVHASGDPDNADACPFCGAEVHPLEGAMLGQVIVGDADRNPEPWQEIAECPDCHASLVRIPGNPWRGTSR
jgi:hypothetical protein